MTKERKAIKAFYEDHFFPEAAQHLDTILRGKNEAQHLRRLHQSVGMKPWQLLLMTEAELCLANGWAF